MAKILVVDDAAFMRLRAAKLLVEAGHQVLEAENGRMAVETYLRERPDCVLMDITMPEMDGLEALAEIRLNGPACTSRHADRAWASRRSSWTRSSAAPATSS